MTALAPLVFALSAGCAAGGSAPAASTVSPPGARVTLAIGDVADIRGAELRLRLDDVAGDSRCPKGEQCVRAGEAIVAVSLIAGDRTTAHRLCIPGPPSGACDDDTCVELVALDPYPRSGHEIEKKDYRATFEVTTGDRD